MPNKTRSYSKFTRTGLPDCYTCPHRPARYGDCAAVLGYFGGLPACQEPQRPPRLPDAGKEAK